jgi:[ribosomal protein S5]-alanine N-acetyltransferase
MPKRHRRGRSQVGRALLPRPGPSVFPDRIVSTPVLLRSFRAQDAAQVQVLAGDIRVARTTGLIPHPYLDGMAEAWIASHEHDRSMGTQYTYAVTRHEDGLVVGAVSLRPLANEHENLGYWIGHPFWGCGYATAAARALVALAFSSLDCNPLTASYLAENPASGRVLDKCGFSIVRRFSREHRGVCKDFIVKGITPEEWQDWIERDASTKSGRANAH